jgi:hypothetical protein
MNAKEATEFYTQDLKTKDWMSLERRLGDGSSRRSSSFITELSKELAQLRHDPVCSAQYMIVGRKTPNLWDAACSDPRRHR